MFLIFIFCLLVCCFGLKKLYFRQYMVYGPQHPNFKDFHKKHHPVYIIIKKIRDNYLMTPNPFIQSKSTIGKDIFDYKKF